MNILRDKNFTQLKKSDIWIKHLKPYLEEIKARVGLQSTKAISEFEAIQRDIERTNTLNIINEIISRVERSENNLSKKYV